jgi:hypothetical protein
MMGQQVKQLQVQGARTQVQWTLSDVPRGTYVLTAHTRNGAVVSRSVIIKE